MKHYYGFLIIFNSTNRNIQFTSESEQDHEIPSLDMLIKRKENNPTLTFRIYRKPTNSGRHLDFKSCHHQRHKKNVVAALRHRAKKICSPEEMKKENDTIFKNLFKMDIPGSLSKQLSLNPLEKTMKLPVNMSKPRILTLKCFLYYMCDAVLKF